MHSCRSPRIQFRLDHRPERLALLRREIGHLVLVVQRKQPELHAGLPPVIDHPQPAALALAPPLVGKTHLAQAARALDDLAGSRIAHQLALERTETLVVEVLRAVALEGRQLDEHGLHEPALIIRKVRIYASCVEHVPGRDLEPVPDRPAGALDAAGRRDDDIEPVVRAHCVTRKKRSASFTRSSPEMSLGSAGGAPSDLKTCPFLGRSSNYYSASE